MLSLRINRLWFLPASVWAIAALATLSVASDEKALLAAIRAHPAEDTPRLMYADWLEEHEQPERAKFIRLQVEAARLPVGDSKRNELEKQANTINSTRWIPAEFYHAVTAGRYHYSWLWERGFPSHLAISVDAINDPDVRAALNKLPVLSSLAIIDISSQQRVDGLIRALPDLELLDRVSTVSLQNSSDGYRMSVPSFRKVLSRLGRVRHLEIGLPEIEANHWRALGESPLAAKLKSLTLRYLSPTASAMSWIVSSGAFPELQSLSFEGGNVPLAAFVNDNRLPALRELHLNGMGVEFNDLEAFVKSPAFRDLRSFELPRFAYHADEEQVAELYRGIAKRKHQLQRLVGYRFDLNDFPELRDQIKANLAAQKPTDPCLLVITMLSERS